MEKIDYATVDRIENDYIIVEMPNQSMVAVKKEDLPDDIKEGDKIFADETGKWIVDKQKTEDEQKRIRSLMDSLFE